MKIVCLNIKFNHPYNLLNQKLNVLQFKKTTVKYLV